jgi:universal stress protein A
MVVIKHVLVATDFSHVAEKALRYGREFATRFGATLHIINIVDDVAARLIGSIGLTYDPTGLQQDVCDAERVKLEALVSDRDRLDLHAVLTQKISTAPASAIVAHAAKERIDVIVMGTHGRGGMAHAVLGSVAERVVRTAPCPVLTVHDRERDFVLPNAT